MTSGNGVPEVDPLMKALHEFRLAELYSGRGTPEFEAAKDRVVAELPDWALCSDEPPRYAFRKGGVLADIVEEVRSGPDRDGRAAIAEIIAYLRDDDFSLFTRDWKDRAAGKQWLIDNWLPKGSVGLLTGEFAAGKSFLALQLAVAIASGNRDWLGSVPFTSTPSLKIHDVRGIPKDGAPVVFASWEDDEYEIGRRLELMEEGRDRQRLRNPRVKAEHVPLTKQLGDRLIFAYLGSLGPVWGSVTDQISARRYLNRDIHLNPWKGVQTTYIGHVLQGICERERAQLLILDPAGAAVSSEGKAGQFMADWGAWTNLRSHSCTVLLVDRVASVWGGGARFLWELKNQQDATGGSGFSVLKCRTNYDISPDPIALRRGRDTGWAWMAST